jgi:predicted nucleic acid-binding protein
MLILDASFAIPLLIAEPRSAKALSLLQDFREEGRTLVVPTLWVYEVTSSLQKLRHFKMISSSEMRKAITSMTQLEVELVHPDLSLTERAVAWSERLKRASAYDSFYLALAEGRSCELWTADKRLWNSANRSWVRLLD